MVGPRSHGKCSGRKKKMSNRDRRRKNRNRQRVQNEDTSLVAAETSSGHSSVVTGKFHQGNERLFPYWSVGKQCSCNCLVSMCHSTLSSCHLWTTGDIDKILMEGDKLYRNIVGAPEQARYFAIDELPGTVHVSGRRFEITLLPLIVGLYNSPVSNVLENAVSVALADGNSCFLTIKGYTICVLQTQSASGFHVFDSHSRDSNGMCAADGTAVLVHVSGVKALIQYLERLLFTLSVRPNEQFDIVPASVSLQK